MFERYPGYVGGASCRSALPLTEKADTIAERIEWAFAGYDLKLQLN